MCQLEDPYRDPAFAFHQLNATIVADILNTAVTAIEVHESEDGAHWRRLPVSATVTPGGRTNVITDHILRWIRIVLFSTGSGTVSGTKITSEAQVLPGFVGSPVTVEEAEITVTVGVLFPPPPQCIVGYTFAAQLDWNPEVNCVLFPWGNWPQDWKNWYPGDGCGVLCKLFYPDLNLYVRDSSDVVYYGNLAGANLALNWDAYPFGAAVPVPPEIITGTYTVANTFYVWYNQRGMEYAPVAEPSVKRVTITNIGTCPLLVNGVILTAGQVFTLNDFQYAGYGTGDMSEWLGGTPVAV